MKKSIFVIIVMIPGCISTAAQKHPLPEVDPEQKKELMEYVVNHYMTPENYIINKFKDHDVVIVGESQIKPLFFCKFYFALMLLQGQLLSSEQQFDL